MLFFEFDWFVRRLYETTIPTYGKKYLRGTLLDLGCGEKPYAKAFDGTVNSYFGLDYEGAASIRHADVIGRADRLPIRSGGVNAVLCTQVLEHVEEPDRVVHEIYRILSPGGRALISLPFMWNIHMEPRDFFRFSRYGLEHLFQKNKLHIVELIELESFWITWLQLLVNYIQIPTSMHRNALVRFLGRLCVGFPHALMFLISKVRRPSTLDKRFTANYLAIVEKKENTPA